MTALEAKIEKVEKKTVEVEQKEAGCKGILLHAATCLRV